MGTPMTQDELLFFNAMPGALPLYDALRSRLVALPGATVRVAKTQITFACRYGFAFVSLRRMRGCPAVFLILTLGLPQRLDSPRIAVATEPYPGRWTHHIILSDPAQLDGELLDWCRAAYDFARAKERRRPPMRIVILSDTHGLLRPEVLAALEGADAIVHGGDINTPAIVDTLRSYAPLYIVRGNNDKEWAEGLPHELRFTLAGVRFYMTHIKRDIPDRLADVDVVVFGHSHKWAMEDRGGVLYLNPGSCGKRRFDQEITFAVMTAEDGTFQVEKVTIPHPPKEAKP